jgi:hypothetical protein
MNTTQAKNGATFKITRIWKPMPENYKQKFSTFPDSTLEPEPGKETQMLNSSQALLKIIGEKQNSFLK